MKKTVAIAIATVMAINTAILCSCASDGNQIEVSFSDGNNIVAQESYEYGEPYAQLPVLEGQGLRTFGGWYTSARGGDKVTAETEVTDHDAHTLYAHWVFGGKIESIDVGADGAFAVGEDGSLWQWGEGVADGYPVQLMEERHIEKVFAAWNTYYALDDAGQLWGWGENRYGQVGSGSTDEDVTKPALVKCDAEFVEVTGTVVGSIFGIDTQGNLWAWGYNQFGQLGDGTKENRTTPVRILSGTKFRDVASDGFVAAIDESGDAWILYDMSGSSLQTKVTEGKNYTDISINDSEIAVLDEDGTVWSIDKSGKTEALLEGESIVGIELGGIARTIGGMATSYFARTQSGDMWVWGANCYGQLGVGSREDIATPVKVAGFRIAEVSSGSRFTVALDMDGKLLSWGMGDYLGNGVVSRALTPEKVMQQSKYKQIVSDMHTLAIDTDGNLWTWGLNDYGQLGDGTQTPRMEPKQIMTGKRFIDVSWGSDYSVAIDEDGQLWSWGVNFYEMLEDSIFGEPSADGDTGIDENSLTPSPVKVASDESVRFVDVESCKYTNLALDEDGYLWTWGLDLSNSGTNFTSTAYKMSSLKFTDIAAGEGYCLALEENGRLWTWGTNNYGQLGDGTTRKRNTPLPIGRNTEFAQIAAAGTFSAAIDVDGNLWVWGNNSSGQLGNGTHIESAYPLQIMNGMTYVQVACGSNFIMALDSYGQLWTWGSNSRGQMGDGSQQERVTPGQTLNGLICKTIFAGTNSCYVLDADGALWTWGENGYGQLVNGAESYRLKPGYLDLVY